MRASPYHTARRPRLPAVRSRVGRARPGARHAAKAAEPEELEMFSDRLDDAAEYQRIIKDFVSVHDAVCSADDYNG